VDGYWFAFVLEDGEPADPGVFATIIPPWQVGDTSRAVDPSVRLDNLAACAETENPLRVANDRGRLTRSVFRLPRCFARGGHRWERRTDGAGSIVSCARCGRMRHGGFRGETFLRAHANLGYRIEFPVSRAVQARGQAEPDGASTRERRRFRRRRN